MAQWKYTIKSGSDLRESIEEGNTEETVECLIRCFNELWNKLDEEDLEDYDEELEDIIDELVAYEDSDYDEDDTETIDSYLEQFYDICDAVRAWISI